MSNNARSKNSNVSRNTARPTDAKNTARPTDAKNTARLTDAKNTARLTDEQSTQKKRRPKNRKHKQPSMPKFNKCVLFVGVGIIMFSLIFPDLMGFLGSSKTGLLFLAGIAILAALIANMCELSIPELLSGIYRRLTNPMKKWVQQSYSSESDEEDFEYQEESDGDGADVDYGDDDYDGGSDEESGFPWMSYSKSDGEDVPEGTFDDTPRKPDAELADGLEWKFENDEWVIQPMTPPTAVIPDGFEWKREEGKWKLVPKA